MSVENEAQRTSYKRYHLPTLETKNYNFVIDGQNFFDQLVRNNLITYDSTRIIATDKEDNYTITCFPEYNYFRNYYKMIAIDLSKQQALDADAKAMQQIDFMEM